MNKWLTWYYPSTSSTMDCAKEHASSLKPNQLGLVTADQQTAGRGQNGRSWQAVNEGIYLTLINQTELSPKNLNGFSLMIACTVAEALREACGIQISLKWPNDLLNKHGAKLGGILVETQMREKIYIYTGIGLNVRGQISGIQNNADLQSEVEQILERDQIIQAIQHSFEKNLTIFTNQSFKAFQDSWNAINFYRNKNIDFVTSEAENTREQGICLGVNQDGHLQIKTATGVLEFFSGRIQSPEFITS